MQKIEGSVADGQVSTEGTLSSTESLKPTGAVTGTGTGTGARPVVFITIHKALLLCLRQMTFLADV